MKTNKEDAIVAGFKQGEEKAVKQIFERFHKELVGFATRITGNRSEAQDIVVEAFLKILPKAQHFTSLENIRAFLYVVTRHACYAWVEKQTSLQKKDQDFLYVMNTEIPPDQVLMDQEEMTARVLQQLYEFIQLLPPQEKKVFVLKMIHQKSADEISAELNLSKKTVYNLTSSAINRLRKMMGDAGLPSIIVLCSSFFEFFLNQQEI